MIYIFQVLILIVIVIKVLLLILLITEVFIIFCILEVKIVFSTILRIYIGIIRFDANLGVFIWLVREFVVQLRLLFL